MFELPTLGQAAQLIFLIGLIYWAIKTTLVVVRNVISAIKAFSSL